MFPITWQNPTGSHLRPLFILVGLAHFLCCLASPAALAQGNEEKRNPQQHNADQPQAIHLKVLVLNYDPFYQGKRLHEVLGFNDPRKLAEGFLADVKKSTKGRVVFDIVEWRDLDEIYARDDGGIYQVEDYVKMRREGKGWPARIVADYPRILREQKVVPRIDDGSVDEVWIFCDHYFGVWEASMVGPGAFFINGGVYPDVPSLRPFAFYGFNYERGVAEMLHNTAHRIEATMNRTYGEWNLKEPKNNWELFSANFDQSNGQAGVGTCHWPANAAGDYDYANRREVMSYADDFLNYPNLTLVKKPVSARTWSKDGVDPHRAYMNWYLERLPRASGVNPDGKLNNWFPYIFDFQNYDPGGKPLPNRMRIVKSQLKDGQLAMMAAFSSAAAVDPARFTKDLANLLLGDQVLEPERVHLVNSDLGTYRTASFVFNVPPGSRCDSATLQIRGSLIGDQAQEPFADMAWTLIESKDGLQAIPKTPELETPLEVATWIIEKGGRVGLQGNPGWIDRVSDLNADAAEKIERVYWWREGAGVEPLEWHEASAFQVFDKLRELELRGHPIGDRACSLLARLQRLEVLNLHACGLSDQGLSEIAKLRQLKRLDVGYSQGKITDVGAAELAELVNLVALNIYNSNVTDKFLAETVPQMKSLREMELTATQVTEQAIENSRKSNPQLRITRR